MPLLLEACPSFRGPWEAHVAEPDYDAGLLYIDLGELARHLVELARSGATGEFAHVFEVVERLHLDGDEYVREAATIGLLEGIQNIAAHRGVAEGAFVPYLQPESARWWVELLEFWDGKSRFVGSGIVPRS